MSTDKFNVLAFSKSFTNIFSKSESKVFDADYINTNQSISVSETDGVGACAYNYALKLKDSPQKIISISIKFDEKKQSIGNIVLRVVGDKTNRQFDLASTSISNCEKLILVSCNFANDVEIISVYDSYGGAILENDQIVHIESIKINDESDISVLKKELLIDFIKSIAICAIGCIVVLLLVKSTADKKIFKDKFNISKVFLFTTLIVGLIFSFLIPVYQVPDEQTHIEMMYQELNWDVDIKTQSEISDFADTLRIIRNYDQKINMSTYFNNSIKSPLPDEFSLPSMQIVRHLPQAIGFLMATLVRLPLWLCAYIAEFFAAITYAVFGYFTIKIIPFKKELMTVIMLLPICLQEFPSFSYDSFLFSVYFLLFAYILYVKFTKEKFTLTDVFVLLLLTMVVVIIKIPYALVIGLVLTIPISKIDFNFGFFRFTGEFVKKHKIIFLIIAILGTISMCFVAIKLLPYVPEGSTFLAAVYDIGASTKLILATIKACFTEWLIKITGNLGWFDTPVALIFTVFVIANLLFVNLFDYNNTIKQPANCNPFKAIEIAFTLAIALFITIIVILSMLSWTLMAYGIEARAISVAEKASYMRQIPLIGGLQGRYFVPVIPLFLVPCYFPKISKQIGKFNHITYLSGYHLTVFVYLVFVLLNRYWL